MTGSLLSLAANKEGEQDVYLTGNQSISFFRNVYKKYTNFSKEIVKLYFTESEIKLGHNHYCNISRKGSLLSKLYLYVELPELQSVDNNESWKGYISGVGYTLIKSVTLKIGGMEIDKIDSNLFDIFNEMYDQDADPLVGKFNSDITLQNNSSKQRLYIPLHFWFTKNEGLSLPVEALRYHEIEVIVEFRKLTEIIKSNVSNLFFNINMTSYLIGNFIHLDDNEKKYFTKNKHEYLIEQTQILPEYDITTSSSNVKVPLELKASYKGDILGNL